jgi:hypothetical protein
MILQVHRFILTLPPQVDRKQPVYFIDAFGKESAFFLEWVFSREVSSPYRVLKPNAKTYSRYCKIGLKEDLKPLV